MKKKIIIIATLIFAVVGISGTAFSWNHNRGQGYGHSQGKRVCRGFDNAQGTQVHMVNQQNHQFRNMH